MRYSILTGLLLLCLCTAPSEQQISRCLLSREDYLLCKYQNGALVRASSNEYSIHHTRLRQSSSGYLECNVRAREQDIRSITTLGTDALRILFSPGFILGIEYDNQLRTEYRVQCAESELAFFNVTNLNLQSSSDCMDSDNNARCQDYLQIVRGNFGTTDICGTLPSMDAVIQLEFGDYTAVFRTSEEVRGVGFDMYTVCFRPAEESLEGCFNVTEFMTGVCSNETLLPSTTVIPTPSTTVDISTSSLFITPTDMPSPGPPNTKRSAGDEGDVSIRYADLFPELYPEHLVMSRDLAEFHHQWNSRVKRGTGNRRPINRNILFNETVNYSDNTISIFGPDSQTRPVDEFKGVLVLQTFDTMGRIEYHKTQFQGNTNPHFASAGPLTIIDRHAYYQLFVIDPRGLLPNEDEQRELVRMTTALLAAVPPSEDLVRVDPNQTPGDLSAIPGIRNRRQQITTLTDIDREAILAALRSQEACNPVLRAQSRATLEYFNSVAPEAVSVLRVFDITCSLLSGNTQLMCTSDSTTLTGRTMCQIDNFSPVQCEPFQDLVDLSPAPVSSVNISTINCLGQRASQVVSVAQSP